MHQIEVIEPIPSAALEIICKQIPTSYKLAYAKNLGSVLDGDKMLCPEAFPASAQFRNEFPLENSIE